MSRYLNQVNVSEGNVFLVFDTAHDSKGIQTFSQTVPTPINCLYTVCRYRPKQKKA